METDKTKIISEYMASLGRKVTPAKLSALSKNRERLQDVAVRNRMRESQQRRRNREKESRSSTPKENASE